MPHSRHRCHIACILLCLITVLACPTVAAAPYTPSADHVVLERLPTRAGDADTRRAGDLRRELTRKPGDPDLSAELAGHYFRLAQRDGDPRYIGYAQAVIAGWPAPADAPPGILLVRALLAQFIHDFAGAGRDLDRILERDPDHLAARSYRAILHLVQAQYDRALGDCRALASRAKALVITACEPTVRAILGDARRSYGLLSDALASNPDAPANEKQWVTIRLAEIAHRLGRSEDAEAHFRNALAMGQPDQYLLATYAEFLLDSGRAREVIPLLRDHTRNDVLLLRLLLAEQATSAPGLGEHRATLGARIDAARRRGDELHLADEAIFEMTFRRNPGAAVRLASRNWSSGQREPSDARVLLETAWAARDPVAAAPALEWLRSTGHEDRRLQELAARIAEYRR